MQTVHAGPQAGPATHRPPATGTVAAAAGLALFIYFVNRAGVSEILNGIARLKWAFVAVLALSGFRFLTRAAAWIRCLDRPHRVSLLAAVEATLTGDALGNLTPLSLFVSEPAKAMCLRHREPVARTLPALAVENLFYSLSAILLIASGLVGLFLLVQTKGRLWVAMTSLVVTIVALISAAHWIIWNRIPFASRVIDGLARRRLMPHRLDRWSDRLRRLEHQAYSLYPRSWSRLLPVALWELAFHVSAITEIYLVLSVISDVAPTVLDAFIFESTNRFITIAFRFVPLRMGVDEAGTAMSADLLRFGTTAGVTLAVVRKARMLVWIAIGITLLVRRGMSVRTVLTDVATARSAAHRPDPAADTDAVVVVMARSPEGGPAPKSRLAGPGLSDAERRQLYTAFLKDAIDGCRRIRNATLRVAFTPDGGPSGFAELGVGGEELLPQRGADLGERERNIFADLFGQGFGKVVIIGSDLPTLPMDHVREALTELDAGTVAIGPSSDGGYYLIGLGRSRRDVPDLFSNIRWSTPQAYEDTIWAAGLAGLRVARVPPWYDVDDEAGLERLKKDLANLEHAKRAPATSEAIRKLFAEG